MKWLSLQGVTVASDAMPIIDDSITWDTPYEDLPNTHPRGAGSRALARENNIPLMQSIAQLSYWSAKHLGDMGLKAMQVRGRLQEGMLADITIFDPDKVKENSTHEKGALPSTGTPYVVVNGTIIVKDSKVFKGVNSGQPIRFEPREKGLFEPISIEKWTQKYMVAPVEFGGTVPFGEHTH